jgi:hypothetical protein
MAAMVAHPAEMLQPGPIVGAEGRTTYRFITLVPLDVAKDPTQSHTAPAAGSSGPQLAQSGADVRAIAT